MTEPRLVNGTFEAPWQDVEGGHEVHIFRPHGAELVDRGSIFTPPGWVTWFYHVEGSWDQPEVKALPRSVDPGRVHSGDQAWLFFWKWRCGLGGLYQLFEVEPGDVIGAGIRAHAWSNGNVEGGCAGDPRWSDGAGKGPWAWRVGSVMPDTGNAQRDAGYNWSFQLGLDPHGGFSPFSRNVVWGDAWHIYNVHHPLTVAAEAVERWMTLFVRMQCVWPFEANDGYVDSASVFKGAHVSTRGQPRRQYERTYHLVPPDATLEEGRRVFKLAYTTRGTVGHSADDAGVGDLDVRKVIAYEPQRWKDPLGPFFEQHYPLVQYQTARIPGGGDGPPPPKRTRGHIGLHIQQPVAGLGPFIEGVRPPVVTLVGGFEQAVWIKQVSPDTVVILRQHVEEQGKYGPFGDVWDGAERFLATHLDAVYILVERLMKVRPALVPPFFYVEGLNEEYGTGTLEKNRAMRDWDLAFGEVLSRTGLPIAPVYLNAAVGNPPEGETEEILLPLARDAVVRGGLLGYHSYWWMNGAQESGLESWWLYHAGRFVEFDRLLRGWGVAPRWVGTEGGIVESEDGHHLNPGAGYHAVCSREVYVDELMRYDELLRQWNVEHAGRYVGTTLFTSGGGKRWKKFEVDQGLLELLAPELVGRYG